uniref:Uncharacterized protein n=1 Tax=Arundo donax TaxID=35708 RepID=A0A0A8YW86_ARUDO
MAYIYWVSFNAYLWLVYLLKLNYPLGVKYYRQFSINLEIFS